MMELEICQIFSEIINSNEEIPIPVNRGRYGSTASFSRNVNYPIASPNMMDPIFVCTFCGDCTWCLIKPCMCSHLLCESCYSNMSNCPNCEGPLDAKMSINKENMEYPCKFRDSGCEVKLVLDQIREHEKECNYRPHLCPTPGICTWVGSLVEILPHLLDYHKPISALKSRNVNFCATEINSATLEWLMILSCFDHNFLLVLQKQELQGILQFTLIVQLIGSKMQADTFVYRAKLKKHLRSLEWKAKTRSIDKGLSLDDDCFVFTAAVAEIFINNGNLNIEIEIGEDVL